MFTRSQMAHPLTTIAFCARGREIGYVLMTKGRIMRYGVKTIKGKRQGRTFLQRVAQILLDVAQLFTPRCLVVVEDMSHRTKPGTVHQAIHTTKKAWQRERR